MKKIYLISLLSIFSVNLFCQVHWTKHPDNPIMTPGSAGEWDEMIIAPGSIIFLDNTYHMWYWGGDMETVNQRIGYATSPDGITWTKYANNPVIEPGSEGTWDGTAVGDPTVLYVDSIFHMWYEGIPNLSLSEGLQIGHATSLDGIIWTKDTANPVLKLGPDGEWDDQWVSQPDVVYNGNEYHMWYTGYNGFMSQIRIGHATSLDGTTWTKDPANPILNYEDGKWDYPRVDFPKVIYDETLYHMWYSGGVYIAWKKGYATSPDGSIWTKHLNNPLLLNGTAGTWDENFVAFSPVLDSAGVKYKMWYIGGISVNSSGIGYAESMRFPEAIGNNRAGQFRIYPNPTTNILTIETSQPGKHFIDITSLNGQLLYNLKIEGPTHQIGLSSFQKGIYFITIRSKDFVRTEKIIKL